MNKKYVLTNEEIVEYENMNELDEIWSKKGKINLSNEDMYRLASLVNDEGYRVVVSISDALREDFNIYEDSYRLDEFNMKFGEDYATGVERIRIMKNRLFSMLITKACTIYVDIFEEKEEETNKLLKFIEERISENLDINNSTFQYKK